MPSQALRSKLLQRQILAPKLRMQLKILEFSLSELSGYVKSEINNNPLLGNATNNLDEIIKKTLASPNTHFRQAPSGIYNYTALAEAEIRIQKNTIDVELKHRGIPKLHINPFYQKILENPNSSPETKEFVKEQLKKALTLIEAVKKRRTTLKKIIRFITHAQADFLRRKSHQLRPLALKNLAMISNLHVSTLSRIVRRKHVLINGQTIPLKSLLSAPFKNNPFVSLHNIRFQIREILNDSKTRLTKEGIPIARRTVAKYRKSLGVACSFERKIIFSSSVKRP
jgi:DNA-directed RNA polymerase specialized sigma54-like protein